MGSLPWGFSFSSGLRRPEFVERGLLAVLAGFEPATL